MDIEKLRAILEAVGIESEKIEAALELAAKEEDVAVEPEAVEETPEEGNNEESSTSDEVPTEEGEPASEGGEPVELEGEGEVVPPQDEVPADPASVPPVEEEVPPEAVPPEVVEGGVPAEPVPELPPVVSLEEFNQVKSDLEETKKALEGAKGTIESLVQSLKDAGIISGASVTPVGQDQPSVPGGKVNDVMDDILHEINTKGY